MPRELEWQCECNWSWHPFGNSARCVAGFWTTKSVYKIDLQNQSLIHNPAVALHPGPVTYLFFLHIILCHGQVHPRTMSSSYQFAIHPEWTNKCWQQWDILYWTTYQRSRAMFTIWRSQLESSDEALSTSGIACALRGLETPINIDSLFFLIAGQERSGRGCSCAK